MPPVRPSEAAPRSDERVRSVTEFTREVKAALEAGVRPGWVRGEISNLRHQASGHVYFSLKDAGAQVSAVLFRGDASRMTVALRDGLQVVVFGEISLYEPRGAYQLVVRVVIDDGVGRLQREFEALKQRLAAEGLFAPERKRPLPTLPHTIGFVTSPTGAAVQDFCRILIRRGWRGHIIVIPAKVQGEGAAAELAACVEEAGRSGRFDLLVVGRGGGSLEDLWAFNEEVLVRAIASSATPTISAVGHEIDFTLCDFAADLRAETPSAAAELISSHFVAAERRATLAKRDLLAGLSQRLEKAKVRVAHLESRLRLLSPQARLERAYLRLDDLQNRLGAVVGSRLQTKRGQWVQLRGRFAAVHPDRRIELASQRLLGLWKRLQAASPQSVLQRGYALVRDASGRPVLRAQQAEPAGVYRIEFIDGQVTMRRGE